MRHSSVRATAPLLHAWRVAAGDSTFTTKRSFVPSATDCPSVRMNVVVPPKTSASETGIDIVDGIWNVTSSGRVNVPVTDARDSVLVEPAAHAILEPEDIVTGRFCLKGQVAGRDSAASFCSVTDVTFANVAPFVMEKVPPLTVIVPDMVEARAWRTVKV